MSRTVVVTVNYNGAEDTARCVESLLRSPDLPPLVVVDNASSTGAIEKAVDPYPSGQIIYSPVNLGFGRGNNLGLRWVLSHTNCEFVFLLNNDTMIEPDTIKKLETTLDNHPEAGLATPRIVLAEEPDVLWYGGGDIDWRKGSASTPGYLGPANNEQVLKSRNVSFASGCAMLVRRGVFDKVGGFDPRFFMYEEDVELCLRIQKRGWTIRYVPEALVLHKGQGSTRGDRDTCTDPDSPYNPNLEFYIFHRTRNCLLNMFTHARGYHAIQFVTFFPVILLRRCAQLAFYGRWDCIRAVFSALQHFVSAQRRPFVDELKQRAPL